MTLGAVVLPAQGTGTTQPDIAVDTVAGREYQLMKLVDGTVDSVTPAPVGAPADASSGSRAGLWINGQLMLFNGTTWDRARGSIANGLLTDVSRVQGTVNVAIVSGAGSGGTALADEAAFTPGTTSITPFGGTYRATRDAMPSNSAGAVALSATRAQYAVLETPNGDSAMDDTLDAAKVSVVGSLPAGAANIGDVDVLTMPAVVISTLPTTPAGTNNIGDVDVLTLPADPLGANADASVAAGAAGSLSAKLRRATQGLEDLKSLIVLAAGTNGIGKLTANDGVDIGDVTINNLVGSPVPVNVVAGSTGVTSVLVEANFTRPSDTTTYANNDQVSNSTTAPAVITLAGCAGVNGGSGLIVGAELIDENGGLTAGQFELWLFDTTRTPNNDNATFQPTAAQLRTVVGVIPFNLSYFATLTGRVFVNQGVGLKFKCAAGTTSLFGNLVVKTAYVPASAERFNLRLFIETG